MTREFVGLKIGANQVVAARVRAQNGYEVVQLARELLPAGLVFAGEVADVEGLAGALRDFFHRHKLPRRRVRLGIGNSRVGVRTIELLGIEEPRQVENAVRFRAQEALPIPLEEAALDYQVIGEDLTADGTSRKRVLLVVAYRDLIDAYERACRGADLRLVGIDLESFALLRALFGTAVPAEGRERSASVAVEIGDERSSLAVTDGRSCEFARVLEWGGGLLTANLAAALELPHEQAEALKGSLSLAGDAPVALTAEQAARAREALELGLQTFARELVSSLQYYQSQAESLGIREVVLAGETAELAGFADGLQRIIGVTTRLGDPLVSVTLGKGLQDLPLSPLYTTAIGLGMGA